MNKQFLKSLKDKNTEGIIKAVLQKKVVRVNRKQFLEKELSKYYPLSTVSEAVEHNPAFAKIPNDKINEIAKSVIKYESKKVFAISFLAGIPGGIAMMFTVPVDITQYFGFMLRTMQKLAYLYGFDDFNLSEEEISDETMDTLLTFFGVMLSVQGANAAVSKMAENMANKLSKSLAQKALTKGTIYPFVKKIAQAVGVKMTKQIFAKSIAKIVPIVGGFVNGLLSYFTFKKCSKKLQYSFKELPIANPNSEIYSQI